MRRIGWWAGVLLLCAVVTGEAQAARVALVIGNDAYRHVQPLRNAGSDARSMAAALEASRFEVMLELNQDRAGMNRLVRTLAAKVSGGDDVVVFFSGHGVQLGGVSYLLPVDIRDEDAAQVRDDAVALQRVLDDIAERSPRFTLVLVDACRDNPFSGKVRNVGARGLAPTSPADGQMVIYAAGSGQKALDRLGEADRSPNGVFTRVWLKEMQKPGLPVHEMARAVREEVKRLALGVGHVQVPALYDQSVGKFFFQERRGSPEPTPDVPAACVSDEALWREAKELNTLEGYDAYLGECAKGQYVAMARAAKKKLETLKPSEGSRPPAPSDDYRAGKVFRDCEGCPEMVVIPAGEFEMGSPAGEVGRQDTEGPLHRVKVGKFALGKYEVTRGEFRRYVRETGRSVSGCYEWDGKEWKLDSGKSWESPGYKQTDEHPVVCVGWEDAKGYVQWLSRRSGQEYRLASESEWEYAARAGSRGMRYWGDGEREACRYANVADQAAKRKFSNWAIFDCDDGYTATAPVGNYRGNAFGLSDMLGNVWELMEDCWNESYGGAPTRGEAWTSGDCSRRVLRGGAWDRTGFVRSASRVWYGTTYRDSVAGFRVARTLPSSLVPVPGAEAVPHQMPAGSVTRYSDLESFKECDGCPEMVVLPADRFQIGSPQMRTLEELYPGGISLPEGRFQMGSPMGKGDNNERPRHGVEVSRFALGKYEVTQGQWRALMGSNPSYFGECGDDCPVEQVSWEDAQTYIRKLNERVSGRSDGPYRLPSEAEWEYGCRGGVGGEEYCGGNDVNSVAWHEDDSGSKTHRVGTKRANRWGLHDLSGNVWEWVEDCWNGSYQGAPTNGEAWTSGVCSLRVVRGGAWGSEPVYVRSAVRNRLETAHRNIYAGFRVARTLP